MQDTAGSLLYRYTYDTIGRLINSSMKANGTVKLQTQHQYDNQNRLASQTFALPGRTYGESFTYDGQNKLTRKVLSLPGGTSTISLIYDYLGRLGSVTTPASVTSYGYSNYTEDDVLHASNYVSSMLVTPVHAASELDAFKLKYSYDGEGNITYVRQYDTSDPENLQSTVHYKYDKQNQLTYESSTAIGTWNYGYDTVGNIRTKEHSRNNSTDESWAYTYSTGSWKDKLTGLSITRITNSGSTTVSGSYTYDDSGNPTSYFNPGDASTWTMTWKNGRELSKAQKSGLTVKYDYDVNGLRTYKTVAGVKHTYVYASGKLLRESYMDGEDSIVLDFLYDQNDRPYILNYTKNGTTNRYYYVLNLQGDVLYLLSTSGEIKAAYTYDAWGNILTQSGTMANRNPLRYRGYYYDSETGFYYLQSRYYDPALGRFINADSYSSTGQGFLGYNMFAYCGNNPIVNIDPDGHFWHIIVGAIIGAVVGGISAAISGGNGGDIAAGIIAGAAGGALAASGAGIAVQAVGSSVISMAENAVHQTIEIANDKTNQKEFSVGSMLFDGAVGFVSGLAGGKGASYGNSKSINTAGKRLLKQGLFNSKAREYYAKVAHNAAGEYVFKPLLKSLNWGFTGSVVKFFKDQYLKNSLY